MVFGCGFFIFNICTIKQKNKKKQRKLTTRGYGFLPNENISHSKIPKLHTSDFVENIYNENTAAK